MEITLRGRGRPRNGSYFRHTTETSRHVTKVSRGKRLIFRKRMDHYRKSKTKNTKMYLEGTVQALDQPVLGYVHTKEGAKHKGVVYMQRRKTIPVYAGMVRYHHHHRINIWATDFHLVSKKSAKNRCTDPSNFLDGQPGFVFVPTHPQTEQLEMNLFFMMERLRTLVPILPFELLEMCFDYYHK